MTLPLASFATAVNCTVAPFATVVLSGEIVTVTTLLVTVSVTAEDVTPSAAAVIWVLPGAAPVATPVGVMVATPVLLLVQASVPPLRMVPSEFFTVAVKAWSCPTTIAALVGETVMLEICVVVVVVEEELLPPQLMRRDSAAQVAKNTKYRRSDTSGRGL